MKARADTGSGFTPPYTTVHVGTVEGGTALNIIPRRCGFEWEYRLMPGRFQLPRVATSVNVRPSRSINSVTSSPDSPLETRSIRTAAEESR
ncbi:MAG: peptidase dimerization domain-containing protein [Candidatus Zixiibacteriota bacterium]